MPSLQVPLLTPVKGVVRAVPREGQPEGTCWDAQNCLPYDRYGRKRLAQRGGLAKEYPNQMSANFVQGMIEAPNIIYPPGVLATPIPGLTQVPSYPASFNAPETIGPLLGPASAGPFAPWTWTFQTTADIAAGGLFSTPKLDVVVWLALDTASPADGVAIYIRVDQNGSSPAWSAQVAHSPGPFSMLPSAATAQSSPDVQANQQVGDTALWTWQITINALGVWQLTDLTDSLSFGPYNLLENDGMTNLVPTILPQIYVVSAEYSGTGGAQLAVTD
jgi:hypothetical protein